MAQQRPTTLILGMGPGLSAALAERFARAGHAVVGFARNPGKSAGLAERWAAEGLRVELRAADAGDFDGLRAAIAEAERASGPADTLIYNAYRASFAQPSALRPEDAVADFRVNVAGALAAARAVLPGMVERGRGTVFFTGGGLALDPTGWLDAASLAVGKAGLRSLALTLNRELAPRGVHVGTVTVAGAIQPGTPFAPERVAEAFWRLREDAAGAKPAEVVFKGDAAA